MKSFRSQSERVMVFIDLNNIKQSLKEVFGDDALKFMKIDYSKMVDMIVGDRKLVGAYIFDGYPVGCPDFNKGFYDKLRYEGFIVDLRENGPYGQKGVDVSLATKAVRQAIRDKYDTAVIASGDKDFIPAIEAIRDEGKSVECVSGNECASNDLKRNVTSWKCIHELDGVEYYDEAALNMAYDKYISDVAEVA